MYSLYLNFKNMILHLYIIAYLIGFAITFGYVLRENFDSKYNTIEIIKTIIVAFIGGVTSWIGVGFIIQIGHKSKK